MMIKFLVILITTSYHIFATRRENNEQKPPGKLIDMGGYKLHIYSKGEGNFTVVIDHSLGGVDGYFLIEEIAKITRVCLYDRAGYGWSEPSPKRRSSLEIIQELDKLLTLADIKPPYLLLGDSFGSYNVRLYAYYFPEKVSGIILTDGLHEEVMLKMPPLLIALKLFFISGFAMSTIGAILGLVRLIGTLGIFELIKPELRQFSPHILQRVKRSFYRHQHWITMLREMWNLDNSSSQVSQANNLGEMQIISIKARTFFKRSLWNFYLPITAANQLRDKMHTAILKLSRNTIQLQATRSSHFVWVDEPQIIVAAIRQLLNTHSNC